MTFHILEHYRFNRDKEFIEQNWDILTASAEFAFRVDVEPHPEAEYDDVIVGGWGNDYISTDLGSNYVEAGDGHDTVFGSPRSMLAISTCSHSFRSSIGRAS